MPSGPNYGVSYGDVDFFSPPAAGTRRRYRIQRQRTPRGEMIMLLRSKMERDQVPYISPPSPPLPASATAPADTPSPSYTAHHSPEYVHVSTRELVGVMDAICSLAST